MSNTYDSMAELLEARLKKDKVKFVYKKVNGELRTAFGTLNEEFLPKVEESAEPKKERKQNDSVLVYYDLEKESFRSCKKDSIVDIVSKSDILDDK